MDMPETAAVEPSIPVLNYAPSEPPKAQVAPAGSSRVGLLYALAAMVVWGLLPIYFKAMRQVDPKELLTHRVVWAAIFLAGIVSVRGGWGAVRTGLRTPRTMLTLCVTTVLIAGNWLAFIYAVVTDRLMEASLGYFLSPLLNVLLGRIFLGERQSPLRLVCVLLAAAGVAYQTWSLGRFPALALFLATGFAIYALIRKAAPIDALAGLLIETALLTPIGIIYLAVLWWNGQSTFGHASLSMNLWLMLAGVLTCLPLLWYTLGARLLKLSTIGFLQYLTPSFQFLLAVFLYGEPFTRSHAISFGLIWTALALFTIHGVWLAQAARAERRTLSSQFPEV